MTRIVRFEEIDGHIMLRVPADVAARLQFVAGDSAVLSQGDRGMIVERADDETQEQLRIGRRIMEENHAVLAALAK